MTEERLRVIYEQWIYSRYQEDMAYYSEMAEAMPSDDDQTDWDQEISLLAEEGDARYRRETPYEAWLERQGLKQIA